MKTKFVIPKLSKRLESHSMKILFMAVCILMLISLISAESYKKEFIKDQTPNGKIQIQKCDGFFTELFCSVGISNGVTVAKYTLDSYGDSVINAYAEGTVELYEDSKKVFSGVEFKDIKGQLKNLRDVHLYILINESYTDTVDDYNNVCNEIIANETTYNECNLQVIGQHNETKYKQYWKEYKNELLNTGLYKWRLEAKKERPNQIVDFILVEGMGDNKLSEWSWWNSSFLSKNLINITENSGKSFSPYQVLLNITFTANMKSDFSDLRFTNSSENGELDYWIENYTSSTRAYVWVKTSLTASAVTQIYMYYNNNLAVSASNGSNTFLFFDDFSGCVGINATKWSVQLPGGYQPPNNMTCDGGGFLHYVSNSGTAYVMLKSNTFTYSNNTRVGVKFSANAVTKFYSISQGYGALDTSSRMEIGLDNSYNVFYKTNGSYSNVNLETNIGVGSKRVTEMTSSTFLNSNCNNRGYQAYDYLENRALVANMSDQSPYCDGNAIVNYTTLVRYSSGTGMDVNIYWVRVANNWTYPEPTYTLGTEQTNANVNIQQNKPTSNEVFNSTNVIYNCSASSSTGVLNLSLYLNGTIIYSIVNSSVAQNLSFESAISTSEGVHSTYCSAFNDMLIPTNTALITFTNDATSPNIVLNTPNFDPDSLIQVQQINLNFTITDNIGLNQCWYQYNGVNNTISCSATTTPINITNLLNTLTFYANDSAGNLNSSSISWEYKVFQNSQSYNSSTYETSRENFITNISYNNTLFSFSSANLIFYNQSYSVTPSVSGNSLYFTKEISIPTLNTNVTSYWNFRFSNSSGIYNFNSTAFNVSINSISFDLCNSTLTVPYINYNFTYETNNSLTTSTFYGQFQYSLGSTLINKTLVYQNTTENNKYTFCFSPSTKTFYLTSNIQYANYNSPTRVYYTSSQLLTNTTSNINLTLLPSSFGIYTSFQIISASLQGIDGAFINITLASNGNSIESKFTDSSGVAAFFLNPSYTYNLVITRVGYQTYSTSITPSQTQYTVILTPNAATTNNATDYIKGITYQINPIEQYLINDSVYEFNITLNSSYWMLDNFGFNLTGSNGSVLINVNSSDPTGGFVSGSASTYNNTNLVLNLYWTVNGSVSSVSKVYVIENNANTGFSIYNGILDLKSYINTGFFGLDSFGLNIIVFLLIFVITGIISYKFSLYTPVIIGVIVFVLTLIADVGLGLIYYDPLAFSSKVPHVATVLIGIITAALIVKEATTY